MRNTPARLGAAASWTARRTWVWLWAAALFAATAWWYPPGQPGRWTVAAIIAVLVAAAGLAGAALRPYAGFTAATAAVSLTLATAVTAAAAIYPACSDAAGTPVPCPLPQASMWGVAILMLGAITMIVHIPVAAGRATLTRWRTRGKDPA